jgi:hypothetical protein
VQFDLPENRSGWKMTSAVIIDGCRKSLENKRRRTSCQSQ